MTTSPRESLLAAPVSEIVGVPEIRFEDTGVERPVTPAEMDMAKAVFLLADQARGEARELRDRAVILDREAARLDSVASAVADGRSIEEALA